MLGLIGLNDTMFGGVFGGLGIEKVGVDGQNRNSIGEMRTQRCITWVDSYVNQYAPAPAHMRNAGHVTSGHSSHVTWRA